MIDFEQLARQKVGFVYLARLIDYPDEALQSADFLAEFEAKYPDTPQKPDLLAFLKQQRVKPLTALQQEYASLFDLNKRFTLYLSYYRYEDSRERGSLLAKLKMLFEMFGVSLASNELSDYLPLLLEFLAFSEWENDDRRQDLELVFQVIEDGTYHILQNIREYENEPYLNLIRLIRNEVQNCLVKKEEI
ncbi:nitrate reductase molybdenum cofactor assembly chaperone [Loigolactobacillus bifermentans]|uniref:Nitrate reductase molybdenum cofactor assembly chaperone n=1 Tax=Loigolactobacillus bifermentans DSM 20003 TaxID=1423726 RepID=A0A0R1H8M1_9LACO|nr:nitrate reductase molybdenum cofactor assembly chaperone [Loigolactobacillus bifermentans]KRK40324.1 nitrate reductase molybdenum cofactor assembly chaperone [Loigolactobacillus bifermentans DSM 20003]QGG59971.1 nitrate reductase molybdenum cofactor assembly chaperone [Loigolactobacillus bifermentans]